MTKIFSDWDESASQLWGHHPIKLHHTLHQSELFSRQTLAELIEAYPRDRYALVQMGAREERRLWREGDIGELSGEEVIQAIEQGRMWLNLRDVSGIDSRYRAVIDQMFDELGASMPGFAAPRRGCGILISSPNAQVYYHADLPGQCLWQIIGRKRVFVYPNSAPFITQANLEDIALYDMELDVPYADWFDRHAQVHELAPGDVLNWPLNAPHRVENLDCLNVSMTVSYSTEEYFRAQQVKLANAILRHKFGISNPGHALSGPSYYAKKVVQRVFRDAGWISKGRKERRPIQFTLDRQQLGAVKDAPAQPISREIEVA